jgi:uncharacterized protein (TIGR02246 family)
MRNSAGRNVLLFALAGLAFGACAAPEPPQAQDVSAEIQALDDQFAAAFTAGDAAAVAALYTEDGLLLPPNGDFVSGREAIQTFWQSVMDMGVAEVRLTVEEAESIGDTAWEVGRATLFTAAGDTIDEAKYMIVWKRTEAGWRLHRDIWNSSLPAAAE